MSQNTIRFFSIASETQQDLVAVAEVTLFPGVLLRGWHILQKGSEVEVLPPHKVYRDPDTGEERVWELLHFEKENMRERWKDKVKGEYLKWVKKVEPPPSLSS